RMTSSSTSTREIQPRARKCLFGKPDPKVVEEWLDESATRMAKEVEAASNAWGFDFRRERPIDQPGPASRHIDYEAVPAETVPPFYRSRAYPSKRGKRWREERTPSPLLEMTMKERRTMSRRVKESEEEVEIMKKEEELRKEQEEEPPADNPLHFSW
ncbi:hypothetical protein PENTCL1PPCAC_6819, partial [Pristionchus entomophagus]